MNDIQIYKIQSLQRCIQRAREEYDKDPDGFKIDFTSQDAAVLNILRACEQSIDLANHVIKLYKLGIPNSSSESFEILGQHTIINRILTRNLKNMVHFRNIATHQYERMNIDIVIQVIQSGLNDLVAFTDRVKEFCQNHPS